MPRGKRAESASGGLPSAGVTAGVGKPDNIAASRIEDAERSLDEISRKSVSTGIPTVSPIDLASGTDPSGAGDGSSGTAGVRRGRKPGSKNRITQAPQTAEDIISDLTAVLMVTNGFIANWTKIEEFNAPEERVTAVTESAYNLAKLYAVELNPKTIAKYRLGGMVLAMYGPGILAIMSRPREPQIPKLPAPLVPTPIRANGLDKPSEGMRASAPQPLTPSELNPEYPKESFD